MKTLEKRSIQSQVDAGKVRVTIPFNSWSEDLGGFRERIAPGAFNRTLNDGAAEVLAYWNHNSDAPLGRRSAGTLDLAAGAEQLAASITGDATSWSADAKASIDAGNVRGASFGFYTVTDFWERQAGEWRRTLLDAELVEVSPTPNPAYSGSTATTN